MRIYKTVEEVRAAVREAKVLGKSVGLVPTMGALHQGHASLIKAASDENDFVVVSVFVNPTQFAPTEDFDSYPRTLELDARLAEKMGAQAVFAPEAGEMYSDNASTWVEVAGHLTNILCGRSRPTHFRGVTTVVAKLFNIVMPDRAYFGQKDGQQAQIIRKMVQDLFMPLEIRIMPLIREEDGVALSSRNSYLRPDQRQAALVLSKSLKDAERCIKDGERNPDVVLERIKIMVSSEPLAALDYVEIYSFPDLMDLDIIQGRIFVGIAVKFENVRLIDNIVVEP